MSNTWTAVTVIAAFVLFLALARLELRALVRRVCALEVMRRELAATDARVIEAVSWANYCRAAVDDLLVRLRRLGATPEDQRAVELVETTRRAAAVREGLGPVEGAPGYPGPSLLSDPRD